MSHPITYAELHSQNPDKAISFYSRLFDWGMDTKETPIGPYTEIDTKEGIPAGLTKGKAVESRSQWVTYVRVESCAQSTLKAKELGAKIVTEPKEIPEGTFSLLTDPTGALFGLFQKK